MAGRSITDRVRVLAEFEALISRRRESWARELDLLSALEAQVARLADECAADLGTADAIRRFSSEVAGFDVTSHESIQRRRAALERRLGFHSGVSRKA
jgi:hypothetical protein